MRARAQGPARSRRARRGERGFSLLELTVASLLLLLSLLVATQLLVEAQRLFALVPRSLRGGEPELAERLLRADLMAGAPLSWGAMPGDPLELERDGRRVVWELVDGALSRRVDTAAGLPGESRRLLEEVLLFHWEIPSPGMVEVRILRRSPAPLEAAHLSTPGWALRGEGLEMLDVLVTARRSW